MGKRLSLSYIINHTHNRSIQLLHNTHVLDEQSIHLTADTHRDTALVHSPCFSASEYQKPRWPEYTGDCRKPRSQTSSDPPPVFDRARVKKWRRKRPARDGTKPSSFYVLQLVQVACSCMITPVFDRLQ